MIIKKYTGIVNLILCLIMVFVFSLCTVDTAYSGEEVLHNILLGENYEVSSDASSSYPDTGGEITDGKYAVPYLTDQGWQGRENVSIYTITVNLGETKSIGGFKSNFLKYESAGVILPDSVQLSISNDGYNYTEVCKGSSEAAEGDVATVAYVGKIKERAVCRYVRLTVTGRQWSFIDEWEVYGFDKKEDTEPRFYGTFLQPDLCEKWSEKEWNTEFELMREVRMDHLILQWTADSKNMTTVYPSSISGFYQNTGADIVAKVLEMGEKYDIDIYLGLQLNEDWFGKYTNDSVWLNEQGEIAVSLARDLWAKYKKFHSFAGWYLSFEVDNWNFAGKAQWKLLTDFYNKISSYTHSLEEQKPIMISPFYNTVGGLNSRQWTDMWEYILSHSDIDILALQDGVGAGHVKSENLAEWFEATAVAIKNSSAKTALWADTETFCLDRQPMPTKDMVDDINAVLPYVDKFTCFSFNHYLSPRQVPDVYYNTYKMYVETGTVDSQSPSVPQDVSAKSEGNLTVCLGWGSSSDDVGVAGYNIYRDGILVRQTYTQDTEFTDVQLEPKMGYSYAVTARDAAGNESSKSAAATASTHGAADYNTVLSQGKLYTYGAGNPNDDPEGSKLELYKDLSYKKLTDGISGSDSYDDGTWVGIENGKNLSVTLDLQKIENIHEVTMEFRQDISAYIFLPSSVKVEASENGNTFVELGETGRAAIGNAPQIKKLRVFTEQELSARYIRLTVYPGSFAWTFLDEITIR